MRQECDISKTHIIADLLSIPRENRDNDWKASFFENVSTASFACGDPQIINGPDGYPYFVIKLPEPNVPFDSFCINNMKDDFLLEKGYGVVINPIGNSVDWVFSYGDIVNLHLRKEFYTAVDKVSIQNIEVIKQDEQILVAQPSESYLPIKTRNVLRKFLIAIGVQAPKIMMISRQIDGQIIQELAFNLYREDFKSIEELNVRLQQISWFLPRQYIVLVIPKNSDLANKFADL